MIDSLWLVDVGTVMMEVIELGKGVPRLAVLLSLLLLSRWVFSAMSFLAVLFSVSRQSDFATATRFL